MYSFQKYQRFARDSPGILPKFLHRFLPQLFQGFIPVFFQGHLTVLNMIFFSRNRKCSRIVLGFFLRTSSGIFPKIVPEFFRRFVKTLSRISCWASSPKYCRDFYRIFSSNPNAVKIFFSEISPRIRLISCF